MLSVLMSVYYKEKPEYLQQALKSIWDDQTVKPDEIILVEDGKLTAELYEIIEQWDKKLDGRLKRIPLSENRGLAKALNTGIKYCSGEYIARMDSDDISASERFEKQTRFLKNNPDIDFIGSAIREFNDDSEESNIRYYPKTTEKAIGYIVKASPFAHPSVMFRRNIFDDGNLYPEKYNTSQDVALWFQLLKQRYNMTNLEDVLLYYRISNDFYSRRSRAKAINEFKIYWNGIINLYGFTWKLIYPILRLGFRFSPKFIVRKIYTGRMRKNLNKI
jgi:glycosyltransferase involved in cell wall biosynthesis